MRTLRAGETGYSKYFYLFLVFILFLVIQRDKSKMCAAAAAVGKVAGELSKYLAIIALTLARRQVASCGAFVVAGSSRSRYTCVYARCSGYTYCVFFFFIVSSVTPKLTAKRTNSLDAELTSKRTVSLACVLRV